MTRDAEVRALALALPEVEEQPHFDRPSFRVRGRIFVTLRPDEGVAILHLDEEQAAALVGSEPETFEPVVWGRLRGRVQVRLERVHPGELAGLVEDAWRATAPRRLVRARDAGGEPAAGA